MAVEKILTAQRAFFLSDATKDIAFRKNALLKLYDEIVASEQTILDALHKDLNKSYFEGYMSEVGTIRDELRYVIRHINRWARPVRVSTPLAQFPARSIIYKEPYGVVLIMSPWNYPFQLTLSPLIGAIAGGNCAVIKPSEFAPATAKVIADLIAKVFLPEYMTVVLGGVEKSVKLLEQSFDFIFFTGSTPVGRIVMEKAARHLTPVCLELGGKCPAIIDETANLKLAAKRLCWGKFLNAGQTCVAPDYILIHERVKDAFLFEMKKVLEATFPQGALQDESYVRIINEKHFFRLKKYLSDGHTVIGGKSDAASCRIEPTVLDDISYASPVMQEEIFGPILPVLTYRDLDLLIADLKTRPKPLALYIFSSDKNACKKMLSCLSFGGGCINDTVIHLATHNMGFGGVGDSGMGTYHGKRSFDTFSHEKSIVDKKTWLDLPVRYRPFETSKSRLLRMFLK